MIDRIDLELILAGWDPLSFLEPFSPAGQIACRNPSAAQSALNHVDNEDGCRSDSLAVLGSGRPKGRPDGGGETTEHTTHGSTFKTG